MSAEAEEPETAEKADEAPEQERRGCLATIVPSTTPGCASVLTAVFLLVTVITVWTVFWWDPDNIPWRHAFSWWRIAAIVGLMIAIPIGVYKTVSLWLEGDPNAFPDLDYAWRAGMHALASNELSITSVPVFVITGSSGETQEKSLMNATGMRFSVEGVPQGPAPIHWYANSEAIYLFCTDASWTSALASLREELALEAATSGVSPESPSVRPAFDLSSLIPSPVLMAPAEPSATFAPPPVNAEPAPRSSAATSGDLRGTIVWNESGQPQAANAPMPAPTPTRGQSPDSPGLRGTLILGEGLQASPPGPGSQPPSASQAGMITEGTARFPSSPAYTQPAYTQPVYSAPSVDLQSNRKPVLLSHQYSTACLQELQHLGQLLRRARQPLCAINGVLAMIHFESIHSTPTELEELHKALRADMQTIQYACQLRVPVSALVVGLEKERGFRELVLRVGKERAFSQRFGRRFDVHALPTKDELAGLAIHVCGVFEDWAYSLFREEDALTRPGNTRLYELLSKVRCEWKVKLSDILCGGFGCETNKLDQDSSLLFSGCYFAATGETTDRQAFVKGVIDKLNEEQEMVEWTPQALRSNQRQKVAANLGMFVTLGLLVSLGIMMWLLST
ncbi:MAG: hypothetical protein IT423_07400 [Pirellulaceae bacterium]|nr:hypothetical protein [Pirellulaceae bacterium]